MKKRMLLLIAVGVLFLGVQPSAADVLINPITPDIIDDLKKSSDVVNNLDAVMGEPFSEITTLYETYKTNCKEKGLQDKACVEVKKQLKEKYVGFLKTVKTGLGEAKEQLGKVSDKLGTSIKKELNKVSLKEVYNQVAKKSASPPYDGPMSKRLYQIARSLQPAGTNNLSIFEMSLNSQVDMMASKEILDFIIMNVDSQMIASTFPDYEVFNPEMASTMRSIGGDMFGYDVSAYDYEDNLPDPGTDPKIWD